VRGSFTLKRALYMMISVLVSPFAAESAATRQAGRRGGFGA
jgi:hypothetical protein